MKSELDIAKELVKKAKLKEEKKRVKWHMFKSPQCCSGKSTYYGGAHSGGYVETQRCECSRIYTDRYEKFLSKEDKMSAKDFMWKKSKFYDNNDHLISGNNSYDRSW